MKKNFNRELIIMKEQQRHIDAYFYWFNLTEKGYSTTDSIKMTAKHMGVEERSVWNWYREFDWDAKAIEKRKKIVEEVEKQENKTLAENRANYLKILHKLLDNYIKDGLPTQIESVKDLEIVIKNCLVLQNAPSEVTKTDNVNVNLDAEQLFDEDLMKKIAQEEHIEEETDGVDDESDE